MRSKIKIIFSMKQLYLTCGVFSELKNIKSYKNVYYSDGTSRTSASIRLSNAGTIARLLKYQKALTLRNRGIYDNRIKPLSERTKNVC